MSVNIINTGTTHSLNGMADKWDLIQLIPVKIFPVEDDRGVELCCANQLVLADNTGISNQNDISGFMFQVSCNSDTLDIFLEKDNIGIAQLNSSTYGTYYSIGSITHYYDQSLLTGYILEWSKVLAAHGIGSYRIRVDYTSFSGLISSYSSNYNLKTYSSDTASGTIRIESYMNGYMMRQRMNFKDLNFPDMIRVRGWFGNADEKLETTNDIYANYFGQKRVVVQRKVNVIDIYILELLPLPKCLADKIKNYHFLANTIYMSDYNNLNYDYDLKRIRVLKNEAFDFKYTGTTRGIIIKGKLQEQIIDNQKTNAC